MMAKLHGSLCGCMDCTRTRNEAIIRLHSELETLRNHLREIERSTDNVPESGGIRLVSVEQDTLLHDGKPTAYKSDIALTFALAPEGVDKPLVFQISFSAWCALNEHVGVAMAKFLGVDVDEIKPNMKGH